MKGIYLPAILVLILSLCGCAAIRVDVDVYKGPLSNNEDVQLEQMAAMAIGAKPLLVHLKRELAEEDRKEGNEKKKKEIVFLKKSVEEILLLYNNRSDVISIFEGELDVQYRRYRDAMLTFNDSKRGKLWREIEGKTSKSPTEDEKVLIRAYEDFFTCALDSQWTWKEDMPKGLEKLCSERSIKADCVIPGDNTNEAFDILRKKEAVSHHADMLFGSNPDLLKEQFVLQVNSQAKAFLEMRAATHELMKVLLKTLKKKDRSGSFVLDADTDLGSLVIQLAAKLVQPTSLKVALATGSQVDSNKSIIELEKNLKNLNEGDYMQWDRNKFREVLKQKLQEEPEKTASGLLDADKYLETIDSSTLAALLKTLKESQRKAPDIPDVSIYATASQRYYGIARGPIGKEDTSALETLNNIREIKTSSSALYRGRLDDGLETLIENYLVRASDGSITYRKTCIAGKDSANKCAKADLQECDIMIDALVNFAEKVQFVANHRILFEANHGVLRSAWNQVERLFWTFDDPRLRYTMVLQAISNSIISMADDHKNRRRFDGELNKRWKTEVAALKNTFSRDASTVLNLIAEEMRTERNALLKLDVELSGLNDKSLPTTFDKLKGDIEKAQNHLKSLKGKITDENVAAARVSFNALTLGMRDRIKEQKIKETSEEGKVLNQALKDLDTFKKGFDLNTAIITVDNYRKNWADGKGNTAVNAVALQDELILKLKSDYAANKDLDLETTWSVLGPRKFNTFSLGLIDDSEKDPRQVLDQLVATLRYQYIQEVGAHGAESAVAKNIDAAMKVASSYRSSMLYFRPTASYLRNSYPSTSLQPTPGINWTNMLAEQEKAFAPYPVIMAWKNTDKKEKIIDEIDKQFWQNVNSIRLGGGGRTNYVIAKDDIGNWYVKAYASDTEDIVKSVRNLALFSLGPKLKANMLEQLKSDKAKVEKVSSSQADSSAGATVAQEVQKNIDTQPTVMEQLFDKYSTAYTEQTGNDKAEILKLLKDNGSEIKSRIIAGWNKSDDIQTAGTFKSDLIEKLDGTAEDILKPSFEELEKAPDASKKTEKSDGYKIISALSDTKRFFTLLRQRIYELRVTAGPRIDYESAKKNFEEASTALANYNGLDPDEQQNRVDKKDYWERVLKNKLDALNSAERAEKAAVHEAASIIREMLGNYANKRKEAVNQYKTAIKFISETTMQ